MIKHDEIFCHKEVYGYIFICQKAERVHGQKKIGKPCSRRWKKVFVFNDNFMFVKIVHYVSRKNSSNLLRTSQGECHCSGSWLRHWWRGENGGKLRYRAVYASIAGLSWKNKGRFGFKQARTIAFSMLCCEIQYELKNQFEQQCSKLHFVFIRT